MATRPNTEPEDEVQAAIMAAKALTERVSAERETLADDAEPLIPHWRATWSGGELVEQESFGSQFSAEELLSVLKDQD